MADDNLDRKRRPGDATSLSPKNDELESRIFNEDATGIPPVYAQEIPQATNLLADDVAQSSNRQNSNIDRNFTHGEGYPAISSALITSRSEMPHPGQSWATGLLLSTSVIRIGTRSAFDNLRKRYQESYRNFQSGSSAASSTGRRGSIPMRHKSGDMLGLTWPQENLTFQTPCDPSVQDLNQILSTLPHQSQITWAQGAPSVQDLNQILSALPHPPQATVTSSHRPDSRTRGPPTLGETQYLHLKMRGIYRSRKPVGQKCFICNVDLSVLPDDPEYQETNPPTIAVLPCGHTFHDQRLQDVTPKKQASDPPCIHCSPAEN